MTDADLQRLIEADELGLLKVKPKRTPQSSEEEQLLAGFCEISQFVEEHGRCPLPDGDINEKRLAQRLSAIRSNPLLHTRLTAWDNYSLLDPIVEENPVNIGAAPAVPEERVPTSIDEILADEFIHSLSSGSDIFNLKHVPAKCDVESPDYVAQRKPCKDFDRYEEQLLSCQRDLKTGRRKLLSFAQEQQIEVGKFFVLRGVLLLVVEVGERTEKNGKWNARLRCIFENGTESDMLLRSLSSELYKDGRRITEPDETLLKPMVVSSSDKESGYIYVLRSLSTDQRLKAIPNLYKIGLARKSIETRIQNAANEPTYLMAPVALVSSFQCYNLNLPKLENLIHRFFDAATVRLQVQDTAGNFYTPHEWFDVPLDVIHEAVHLLIAGTITDYQYDVSTARIKRL